MIKIAAFVCIAAGALAIALAVFLFFRLNAYAVYKDLRSTEKIHIEANVDEVARSMYYENQIIEPKEEKVIKKPRLGFRREKEKARIAKDDTSILYAESLEENTSPPASFKREEEIAKEIDKTGILMENTQISSQDISAKEDVQQRSGTQPLSEEEIIQPKDIGTVPLKASPEQEVSNTKKEYGTEPLTVNESRETEAVIRQEEITSSVGKISGTQPLSDGTQPLEAIDVDETSDADEIRESGGTAPLKTVITGTAPLGEVEETSQMSQDMFKQSSIYENKEETADAYVYIDEPLQGAGIDPEKNQQEYESRKRNQTEPLQEEPVETPGENLEKTLNETKEPRWEAGENPTDDTGGVFVVEDIEQNPDEFFGQRRNFDDFLDSIPIELKY